MELEAKKVKTVHHVLAHSYVTFFAGLLLGILLSYFIDGQISAMYDLSAAGIILIAVGSIIIVWAQSSSRSGYDYTRGLFKTLKYPTHWGLMLLVVGYAFMNNSLTILITVLLATLFSFLIFIPKYRHFLNL